MHKALHPLNARANVYQEKNEEDPAALRIVWMQQFRYSRNIQNSRAELEIRGRTETVQTTGLLRSAWILRRDLEI